MKLLACMHGCVAWPADASASLACVLCSSVCLHVCKLHAVCVLLEREEGDGICFCVDREGRGQLLLPVQTGARGWSMELNGLLFKAQ